MLFVLFSTSIYLSICTTSHLRFPAEQREMITPTLGAGVETLLHCHSGFSPEQFLELIKKIKINENHYFNTKIQSEFTNEIALRRVNLLNGLYNGWYISHEFLKRSSITAKIELHFFSIKLKAPTIFNVLL